MTKLLILGELYSSEDAQNGKPFTDGNGRFLKAMLNQVGIDPKRTAWDVVFPITAARGSVLSLFGPKDSGVPNLRFLKKGQYLRREYGHYLMELWQRINTLQPNLILALGDAAMWAVSSETSLKYARGYITPAHKALPNRKVLPTYSPKQIAQTYTNKPYWLADLTKAAREMMFPEIRPPKHIIRIEPSLADMEEFFTDYLLPADAISVDLENKPEMITCIGFAPNPEQALVVPFYDARKPDGNYWPTKNAERSAWEWVRRVLALDKCIYGQNYLYDVQVLWRLMGIPNPYFGDDTMLLHHSLQPEMLKSLGTLASLYTDELSWKHMRTETLKKED